MISFKHFCANAWNWDLVRFCKAMEFDPRTAYARERFLEFQQAAVILGKFDEEKLARLAEDSEPGKAQPGAAA